MTILKKSIYKRILLKLSGEALQGKESFGIDSAVLDRMAQEIKELVIDFDLQVGVVIGGGNLFRGAGLSKAGMNRVVADHMGMLATVMNGLAMRDALHRAKLDACLMSTIPLNGVCDNYNWAKAINLLDNKSVVIFSAGTGNPFFTTDSAACLRGIEIEADAVLKATKVNGVYSSDPTKDIDAKLYHYLTYQEVLKRELKVMDLAAFTLARDYKIPIHIFNMNQGGILKKIIMGEQQGTLITDSNPIL